MRETAWVRRRGWLSLLVVMAGLTCGPSLVAQMEVGGRFALQGECLVIHCEREQRAVGQALLPWGEERCADLARRLQLDLPRRAHVYLFEDIAAFRRVGEHRWDPWVAGVAWPERLLIWMPPAPTLAESRRVLAHELAHLFFAQATDHQPLPRWLEEGAAQYLAGEIDWSDRDRVLRVLARGGWIPLARLAQDFPEDPQQAALAYAQAALFMEFWAEWSGQGELGLVRLAQAVRTQGSLEAALRSGWGTKVSDLEQVWQRSLRRRWRWARWWLQWEVWLWAALLPLLVLWSYRRRRRRWRRHWRQEEEVDGGEAGLTEVSVHE